MRTRLLGLMMWPCHACHVGMCCACCGQWMGVLHGVLCPCIEILVDSWLHVTLHVMYALKATFAFVHNYVLYMYISHLQTPHMRPFMLPACTTGLGHMWSPMWWPWVRTGNWPCENRGLLIPNMVWKRYHHHGSQINCTYFRVLRVCVDCMWLAILLHLLWAQYWVVFLKIRCVGKEKIRGIT